MKINVRETEKVNWTIPFFMVWVLMQILILLIIETNIGVWAFIISTEFLLLSFY